ncbi:MAG: 50S ribosomal protein L25 [Bdellovibrionales bacterium]
MAQQNLTIEVKPRTSGKHFSRSARKEQQIPAVVYGPKTKPLNLSLFELDAVRYSKRGFENTIFTFKSEDKALNGIKVLRKALTIHPLSRKPVHLDFYALDMAKNVRVNVELRFTGKALGVGEGGVFNAIRRDVEVECLPTAIPEFFEVNVSGMGLNESMHVSDVTFPEGVKLITSPQETIANCAIVEEIVAAAPVAAADAAAAPGAAPAAGAPAAAPGAAPAAAAPAAGGDKKAEKK